MAKPRTEQHQFKVPLYGIRVLLIRSTPAAYTRIMTGYCDEFEKGRPLGDGATVFFTHEQRPPMVVIWLLDSAVLTEPYWIGTLAHECWHAVWRMGREIGLSRDTHIESDNSSGEAYAYLHGWLMTQCIERLQRRSIRKRAGRRKK